MKSQSQDLGTKAWNLGDRCEEFCPPYHLIFSFLSWFNLLQPPLNVGEPQNWSRVHFFHILPLDLDQPYLPSCLQLPFIEQSLPNSHHQPNFSTPRPLLHATYLKLHLHWEISQTFPIQYALKLIKDPPPPSLTVSHCFSKHSTTRTQGHKPET